MKAAANVAIRLPIGAPGPTLLRSASRLHLLFLPYQGLPGPTRAYQGLPGPYQGLPGPSRAFQGHTRAIPGPTRAYQGLPGPTRAYQGHTRAYQGLPGPYQGLPGPTRAYQGHTRAIPGPTRAYQGHTRAYQGVRAIHNAQVYFHLMRRRVRRGNKNCWDVTCLGQ